MAKPFISLDGIDSAGVRAEVFVQTGTGTVDDLIEKGNNINVRMRVEGLKHPVQGWTSKSEKIYPMLVEAKESGREVSYRIEAQRKNGIERSLPIAPLRETMELGKENTNMLFVGIDGTLSSEAVTNPAEDPHAGGRIPATDPRNQPTKTAPAANGLGGGFSVEQALTGLANARIGGLPDSVTDAAAALALAAGASVEQVLAAGFEAQQDTKQPRGPVQRGFAKEAKPWVAFNTDSRVNLGSYEIQAAIGAESLAADLMFAHAAAEADAHNAAVDAGEIAGEHIDPTPVDFKNAAALGSLLLDMADRVQVGTTGGGRPDREANSHSRARGLVYDAVKNRHPVPFGQGAEVQAEWKTTVVEEATLRFKYAVRIAFPDFDANQNQQAQNQQAQNQQAGPQRVEGGRSNEQAAQSTGAQVHQISEQRKVPVEGDEGFEAPTTETTQRFGALALAAGFEPTPESPISGYLNATFGVTNVRKVHGPALVQMLDWYDAQGEAGPAKFHQKVLSVVGEPVSA